MNKLRTWVLCLMGGNGYILLWMWIPMWRKQFSKFNYYDSTPNTAEMFKEGYVFGLLMLTCLLCAAQQCYLVYEVLTKDIPPESRIHVAGDNLSLKDLLLIAMWMCLILIVMGGILLALEYAGVLSKPPMGRNAK